MKDPLSKIANNPVGVAPVDGVPVGQSQWSVCNDLHLTCPLVSVPYNVLWVRYPVHVSTLSGRGGPYPAGYVFPVPFGSWPSLLGPSCARCVFDLPCGWLTRIPCVRERIGVATFRTCTLRRGWVPSLLRGRGVRSMAAMDHTSGRSVGAEIG